MHDNSSLFNSDAKRSKGEDVQHRGVGLVLESGVLATRRLADTPPPDVIARYCLPSTSKVMGGAEKPVPKYIFHNSSSVVSS